MGDKAILLLTVYQSSKILLLCIIALKTGILLLHVNYEQIQPTVLSPIKREVPPLLGRVNSCISHLFNIRH